MNLPGNIVAAIVGVSERDWDSCFDELAQEAARQIESTPKEELASLQERVKQIRIFQQLFKEQRKRVLK